MPEELRTHSTGSSVRAKNKSTSSKADDGERKTVFRTALSDPFDIEWPSPSSAVRRLILKELTELLRANDFVESKQRRAKKRKRKDDVSELSPIHECISLGINEVTRSLESLVRWTRWQLGHEQPRAVIPLRKDAHSTGRKRRRKTDSALPELVNGATPELDRGKEFPFLVPSATHGDVVRLLPNCPSRKPKDGEDTVALPTLIFVCKPDINPSSLVDHLPGMVALENASLQLLRSRVATADSPALHDIYLVPLDAGAEKYLAEALSIRRVSALSLSIETPGIASLLKAVQDNLKPIEASWLSQVVAPTLVPTHIKHLKTSQPKNPKAASTARKEAEKRKKATKGLRKEGIYVAEEDDDAAT